MGISENFLVNTKSFDPIIEALISQSEQPDTISDTTLEKMGYDNPSDLLVLHVLRGLEIIHQDKTPSDLYFKMVDPKHTKEAIAEGVINGYRDLFRENYNIHKMLPGEIQEELKDYFDGKKTDLIVKYIANTFHKLVSYAGIQTVEEARDRMMGEEQAPAETDEVTGAKGEEPQQEPSNNGENKPDYRAASERNEISSRSVEEILFGDKPSDEGNKAFKNDEEPATEEAATDLSNSQAETDSDFDMEEDDSIQEFEPTPDTDTEPEKESLQTAEEQQAEEASSNGASPALPEDTELSLSQLNTSDERIKKAVVKRSELQYKLGHYEDALESTEEMIAYFDRTGEEFLKRAISEAVIRRVDLVKKLDQDHKLLPALNEVIRRFNHSDNPDYYEQASIAMLEKAELLESGDFDRQDLLPLYNKIINRLEGETNPDIQERVNEIFISRLKLLNRSDDPSELLKTLDESISRFNDNRRFRKYLEETMFRKAEILEDMNRNEEALEAYTTFLEEFGQPVDS